MTLEQYCAEALERGHGHHTLRVARVDGRLVITLYPDAAEGATTTFTVSANVLAFVSSVTWRPLQRHAAVWARKLERRGVRPRGDGDVRIRRFDIGGREITGP